MKAFALINFSLLIVFDLKIFVGADNDLLKSAFEFYKRCELNSQKCWYELNVIRDSNGLPRLCQNIVEAMIRRPCSGLQFKADVLTRALEFNHDFLDNIEVLMCQADLKPNGGLELSTGFDHNGTYYFIKGSGGPRHVWIVKPTEPYYLAVIDEIQHNRSLYEA